MLGHILSYLSTRLLLPLTTVSRRFHALVFRIIHYRLVITASLPEYKLLLECFHPSSKLTEPHVFCTYLGTDGLNDRHEGEGRLSENIDPAQRLARLTGHYSRFRPEARAEDERSGARLVPSSGRTFLLPGVVGFVRADRSGAGDGNEQSVVTRDIHLDGSEDFSQLCVVVNLVQVMPGSTLLLSALTIEEGIIRLRRHWLRDQNERWKAAISVAEEEGPEVAQMLRDADEILWVDEDKTVGLRMRVREKWNPALPVVVHRDEESEVAYEVDLEGELLL